MARVELTAAAVEDLDSLIRAHSLPDDTRARVNGSLALLGQFPLAGPALDGRYRGLRLLLGPWRWMALIYLVLEDEDRVVVVAVHDARADR
jgi:plasmid stabilization system protein ParE